MSPPTFTACRKRWSGLHGQSCADPLLRVKCVGVHSLPVVVLAFSVMEERDPAWCTLLAKRPDLTWFRDNQILQQFSFYQFLPPLLVLLSGLLLVSTCGLDCGLPRKCCPQKLYITRRSGNGRQAADKGHKGCKKKCILHLYWMQQLP